MQLTINIKDKDIARALQYALESSIYEDWSPEVLKRAGVPKKAELVKQILADEKVMAVFAKRAADFLDGDYMYDIFQDIDIPQLTKIYKSCDQALIDIRHEEDAVEEAMQVKHAAARAKAEQERKEAEEEATIARVIAALKKQGYTIITKN